MKNNLVCSLVAVFLLFSCGFNEEEEETMLAANSLTGTWNLVAQNISVKRTLSQGGNSVIYTETAVGKDFNFTIAFSESPYIISAEGYHNTVTTTLINGRTDTVKESVSTADDIGIEGNWRLSDALLTIAVGGKLIDFDIVYIDDNTVSFKAIKQETSINEGLTINTIIELNFTLSR